MKSCKWCLDGGLNQEYHDKEWGIPLHNDQKHFEFISMEVMQCGLNWTMMLKKREIFRKCFDNFDYKKIAIYKDDKVESILQEDGMIRSERKVRAIINNAQKYLEIIEKYGSFDEFIWSFTNAKTLIYKSHHESGAVAKNELSDEVSRVLKKRGFKYLGSITVYSHLQASGIINDHEPECWMYKHIIENFPIEYLD